jgi:hypothetical protein
VTCRPAPFRWQYFQPLQSFVEGSKTMMTLALLMLVIVMCFIAGTMATHAEQSHLDEMAEFVRKGVK